MNGRSGPVTSISGRLALGAVVIFAVAMALFAWWYRVAQQSGPIRFWGADSAALIREAPRVELFRLVPEDQPSQALAESSRPPVRIDDRPWRLIAGVDVSGAPGFSHVRRSLVEQSSFAWGESLTDDADWQYALWFRDGQRAALVLVALGDRPRVALAGREGQLSLRPAAAPIGTFCREQYTPHDAPR